MRKRELQNLHGEFSKSRLPLRARVGIRKEKKITVSPPIVNYSIAMRFKTTGPRIGLILSSDRE